VVLSVPIRVVHRVLPPVLSARLLRIREHRGCSDYIATLPVSDATSGFAKGERALQEGRRALILCAYCTVPTAGKRKTLSCK
jgi:hypothetical protein